MTEYIGRHRRHKNEISPILKAHLAKMEAERQSSMSFSMERQAGR